jgi:hypothetical protein
MYELPNLLNFSQELNIQRDPKFIQSKEKFFGLDKAKPVKSVASLVSGAQSVKSQQISNAQRLDAFIAKA